ncbi:metalloprotease PmbA [Oceanisphaera pacifica]|uniref:Metalloprotease PmbA n=1 Tax=Oceanisphaera pacifica TaxID=2818389 RepID=A0ABS3NFE7_9GAMM|nr:metalloprotease PmbA [Oceanisphaera pacifica]MBO1519252.1 metalloprotease PmbA [Oceanisphaera pacifica]
MTPEDIKNEQRQLELAVEQALASAKHLGADNAEVSISKQTGLSVNTRNSELENIEFNKDGALGIAVYRDGRKGSASTSDLRPDAIARTVAAAMDISRYTTADPFAGLAPSDALAWDAPELELCFPYPLEPSDGIELALRCEKQALAQDARIKQSDGASFSTNLGIKVYGNSHGFVKGYAASRFGMSCVLIGEQDGDMQREYGYTTARHFADLWTPEQVADEAVSRTLGRLGARKVGTTRAPVLFHPDVAASLFGHLVMGISGGNLYRKSSFLLDTLGERIFPEWFDIHEQPHLHKGLASSPFDNEGVRTVERRIIEQGRLQSYLLPSYAARKMNMEPTGHAGGIHNWTVANTGQSLAQLLKMMGTGLLVTEMMGQGVNIVTGDYSRGAAGFWVENGEIAYPVEEITIAGNLKEMFAGIQAVGTDTELRSSLRTGSVLIDEMKIGGQ